MNYKADTRQETQDRRREGLWSNVLSPRSANEVFLQTMGPGIDFPLIMQYSAVEQKSSSAEEQKSRSAEVQQGSRLEAQSPFTVHLLRSTTNYFYFLNGHGDVTYFADANFTAEEIETYEYTPWGVLLTSASKNNLLYTAREFDFETAKYFVKYSYYDPEIAYTVSTHYSISMRYFSKNKPMIFRKQYENTSFSLRSGDYFDPKNAPEQPQPDDPCCFSPNDYKDCYSCCKKTSSCTSCCIIVNADCHINCYEICTIAGMAIGFSGVVFKPIRILGITGGIVNKTCLNTCFLSCDHKLNNCKSDCLGLGGPN